MTRAIPLDGSDQFSAPVPGEPVIIFKDVRIGFDDREVLQGVSFETVYGETKVLLGEGGSGKTLIMKMAAGLLRPDSGTVTVMGHNIGEMGEKELLQFRRYIGFVFQEGALFDSMTVAENVAFRLGEEGVDETEAEKRVREALRFVEMESALERYPGELSGGMRRRVSIARALVDRPPILFYDSPTAGLDPVTCQTIMSLILRGRDLQGVTSLLATQRVQDAFGLANFHFDKNTGQILRDKPENNHAVQTPERANRALPERKTAPLKKPTGSTMESKGTSDATGFPSSDGGTSATNVLVLRDGKIYFEGAADALLNTSDEYLNEFLASAK
jgi:phospholipid/cholesterol/gamma-HCH transport system ATP-binding protein